MTRIEMLRSRLSEYLTAESKILRGQEYTIGDRKLRRADLSAVRSAIRELEDEIALLEGGGRIKRVVFIE